MPHTRTLTMLHLAELLYADGLFSFKDHVVLALSIASLESLPWQRSLQEVHQDIPVQQRSERGGSEAGCLPTCCDRNGCVDKASKQLDHLRGVRMYRVCLCLFLTGTSVGHVCLLTWAIATSIRNL